MSGFRERLIRLASHSESIKNYLLSQKQRLFNAIVLGVYGGSPNWREVDIDFGDAATEETELLEGSLGILLLNGKERLFAIDGQHRVVGIKNAISENPALGKEEVCALLIAHSDDAKGKQRHTLKALLHTESLRKASKQDGKYCTR